MYLKFNVCLYGFIFFFSEKCYVHNFFTTNHRWLFVKNFNLNLSLKNYFFAPPLTTFNKKMSFRSCVIESSSKFYLWFIGLLCISFSRCIVMFCHRIHEKGFLRVHRCVGKS